MTDELKQLIEEGSKKLPKEVVEVISTFDWIKEVKEIGIKYSLDENEISALENEIGMVIIGAKRQDVLIVNIEDSVQTTREKSVQIAKEAVEKIFNPMVNQIHVLAKNNSQSKNPSWDQTVNFIISGGDYSFFIEEPIVPSITIKPSSIKSNFSI